MQSTQKKSRKYRFRHAAANIRLVGPLLLVCLMIVFAGPLRGADPEPTPDPDPISFIDLAYTYNTMNVADILDGSQNNLGMQDILGIMNDPLLSDDGRTSLMEQMSSSIRANGLRLGMSSPWLPIMNRSRVIGPFENHIIAKNSNRSSTQSGTLMLAQSTETKRSLLKSVEMPDVPTDRSEVIEYEYEDDDCSPGSEYGGIPVHLSCLGKRSKNVWFAPVHSATSYFNDGQVSGSHISRTGFMAGVERGHCPCSNIGIAFGYTAPIFLQDRDSISSDDLVAGVYARKKLNNDLYVNLWFGYAGQQYKQKRFVSVPDLDMFQLYEGKFDGNTLSGCAEIYRAIYCKPSFVLRPLAAAEYQLVTQGAFTEQGRGPFAMSYDKARYEQIVLRCGFASQFGASDGSSQMTIRQRIYYARIVGNEAYPDARASFASGGNDTLFAMRGSDSNRDYLIAGIGGQLYLDSSRSCQFFADYDAIVSTHQTTHAISTGVIHRF